MIWGSGRRGRACPALGVRCALPAGPAVHYPYQNWYFLPGPVGPGVLVLSYLLCWFLLCFCLALRVPSPVLSPVPSPVPSPIPSHAALAPTGFLGFFWSFCCVWVKGKSRGRGRCRVRFAGMRSPSGSTSPCPGAEQGCGRSVLVPAARCGAFAAARGTRLTRGPGVTAENGSLMVVPKEKEKKQKKRENIFGKKEKERRVVSHGKLLRFPARSRRAAELMWLFCFTVPSRPAVPRCPRHWALPLAAAQPPPPQPPRRDVSVS